MARIPVARIVMAPSSVNPIAQSRIRIRHAPRARRYLRIAAALMLTVLALSACTKLPEEYPTPTPIPTPTGNNKPIYTVQRGTIVQYVKALGRIASADETTLFFREDGKLARLYHQTNDQVKKGDLLAELQTNQLAQQIKAAQIQVDIARLKVQQAQQQQSTSTTAGEPPAVTQARAAVATAEAAYAKAQDDLDKLTRGPTAADISAAQAGVAAAQAQLAKAQQGPTAADVQAAQSAVAAAQAQLAKLQQGPSSADVQAAQSAVAAAQAELAKLQQGPSRSDLDAANAAVSNAKTQLAQARQTLADTKALPRPEDVQAAQRAVEQAKNTLNAAYISRDLACGQHGPNSSECKSANATAQADETAVSAANDKLAQAKQPATAAQLAAAQTAVSTAQAAVASAQAKVAQLNQPASAADIAAAQQAVQSARAKLAQVQQGPSQSDVAAAQQAVQSAQAKLAQVQQGPSQSDVDAAQAAVQGAQAKLAQLQNGPTAADVNAAQKAVDSAKAALDSANKNLDTQIAIASGGNVDVQIAQKGVEVAQAQVDLLQAQLDEAQIRAPFDGVVIETNGAEGDDVKAYTPVVTVSSPQQLQIAVEVQATDLTKVAISQTVDIVLTAFPTAKLQGKVVRMPSIQTGNEQQLPASLRTVRVSLPTPPGPVNLGDLANVSIQVQRKDDVLYLPTSVIRTFGGRRFVQVAGPNDRHSEVDVEVGINDDTNTEIVSGLKEGDKVISP